MVVTEAACHCSRSQDTRSDGSEASAWKPSSSSSQQPWFSHDVGILVVSFVRPTCLQYAAYRAAASIRVRVETPSLTALAKLFRAPCFASRRGYTFQNSENASSIASEPTGLDEVFFSLGTGRVGVTNKARTFGSCSSLVRSSFARTSCERSSGLDFRDARRRRIRSLAASRRSSTSSLVG